MYHIHNSHLQSYQCCKFHLVSDYAYYEFLKFNPDKALNSSSNPNTSWNNLMLCSTMGPETDTASAYLLQQHRNSSYDDSVMLFYSEVPASLSKFLANSKNLVLLLFMLHSLYPNWIIFCYSWCWFSLLEF